MPAGHADVSTPFGTTHVPSSGLSSPATPAPVGRSAPPPPASARCGTRRRGCPPLPPRSPGPEPITSTLASFHSPGAGRGRGVGAERGAHAAHLVGGDRRAGARPAEEHAGRARRPTPPARRPGHPTSAHSPSAAAMTSWPRASRSAAHRVGERRCARRCRTRPSSAQHPMHVVERRRTVCTPTPNAAHHDASEPLGEHDVGEQRRLAVAGAVADQHRRAAAVLRVLDRRLLAHATRRAGAARGPRAGTAARRSRSRPRW